MVAATLALHMHAQGPGGSGGRTARGRRGGRGFVGHADISDDEVMEDVPRYREGTGVWNAYVAFALTFAGCCAHVLLLAGCCIDLLCELDEWLA